MRYRIRAGFANITLRLRQNIAGKDAVKIVEHIKTGWRKTERENI
ncbi:MAG: hypothetical protein V8T36_06250 [Ruthenibacterium lactatiformans]|jgi:hypothetical protein